MIINQDYKETFKSIKEESIRCIVTDPPYGVGFNGCTSNTNWDSLTDTEYYDLLLSILLEARRVLTNDGTLWLCCARTKIQTVFKAVNDSGLILNLENWITWCRGKSRSSENHLKSQAEEIIHISKTKNYLWNSVEYLREVVAPYMKDGMPRGWALDKTTGQRVRWTGEGNIAFYSQPTPRMILEPQIHSTQKPVLLWVELIMMSSNESDIILDPFCGSGSSGIASYLCNRDYIGSDIDSNMCLKAKNWMDNINLEKSQEYIKSRVKYTKDSDSITTNCIQNKINNKFEFGNNNLY